MLVDDEGGKGSEADGARCAVDLQLEWVLGKMPQKEFKMERLTPIHHQLVLPAGLTVRDALDRVLRLPAVASKRYLTNKVCVTSIITLSVSSVSMWLFMTSLSPSLRWTGL